MVNYRTISAASIALTIIFAAAAAYFVANPTKITQTTTATQILTSTVSLTATSSTSGSSVNVAYKPGIGFYLTNATGSTLYFRSSDPGDGTSTCTGGCVKNWPLFYVSNLQVAPPLSQTSFTVVNRPDGAKQLAYNGYPLYYYIKDVKVGYAIGQGLGRFFACCTVTSTSVATTTTTSGGANVAKVSIVKGASTNQSSTGYSPGTITVVIGVNNTVTWASSDATIHTVTSSSVPSGAQSFESGAIGPSSTFTFVFTVSGTYRYHLTYIPGCRELLL